MKIFLNLKSFVYGLPFLSCSFLAILIVLTLSGCVTETWIDGSRFGYQYALIENDSIPRLVGDTLYVGVAYSGCNGGHSFWLQYSLRRITESEIWLQKASPNQPCLAYFEEVKTYILPRQVVSKTNITLVGPDDRRIILRPK